MSPSRSDPPSSTRRAIAVVLAAAAGFVDAAGFVALDLFSAHMSGNSARLGVYLGDGLLVRAAPSAFAVAVFVASIVAGTTAMEILTRGGRHSPASAVLGAEILSLVVLAAAGGAVAVDGRIPHTPAGVYYPFAALAVVAMGLQTVALQRISGRTVRTTYVSGMLTNLAEEVAGYLTRPPRTGSHHGSFIEGELGMSPGPASRKRIRLILGIWFAYVAGAVLGGYLERHIHFACFAIPSALIAAVTVVDLLTPAAAVSGVESGEP